MIDAHADVVCSLLRPGRPLDARERRRTGALSGAAFKRLEDRAVDAAVAMQEAARLLLEYDDECSGGFESLRCLHEGLEASGNSHDIVVVENASTDATADVARAHGAQMVAEGRRQISRVRNNGARHADNQCLLFVDADTWPSEALLSRTPAQLDADARGGGVLVEMDHLSNRIAARWSLAAGCFLFVRRDASRDMGGFDERYYAGHEAILSRRLQRWGKRQGRPFVVIHEPAVRSSARKAAWFSPRQHLLTIAMVILFPPAMCSRRLMWFWYRRPER